MTTIDYSVYDEATLAVVCPICRAAATAECLVRKSQGGMEYSAQPHRERVDLAQGIVWHCAACNITTTRAHIVQELIPDERIGTCTPMPEPIPPEEQPPTGDPTETGVVQWAVAATDTDIAFEEAPTTVVVGSIFLIDAEYMTVNDVSNADNIGVIRGTYGTIPADHAAGETISIWAPPD